jgi:hypothetical protein
MVCHWDEVSERMVAAGPMRGAWTNLGSAAGSVHFGLRRTGIVFGVAGVDYWDGEE